jgi:hypothetical protein
MSNITIIPSNLKYKGAPAIDEKISVSLESQSQEITEYDRSSTINLAQVYDDERQAGTVFRPTFKITYLYDNTYTGTTSYVPFQNNLYYTTPDVSMTTTKWTGFPQFYEFDFFRVNTNDQHIDYKSKSAYTYNWTYYLSYAFENDDQKSLTYVSPNSSNITWVASDGIPFVITGGTSDGNGLIAFNCIASHGLTPGESVELSLTYRNSNIFQVFSLGNGQFGSDIYTFNVFDIGYTGTTFSPGTTGTFKRVVNPDNLLETRSKYYVRRHKILTNVDDLLMTKAAFEKNVFNEQRKIEYSSITPNQITRISQKTGSNAYDVTTAHDVNLIGLKDNQKRPLTELFLTIINRGYTGYFNQPYNGVGLKQGWQFNMSKKLNSWWDLNNQESNTTITTSSYTLTNGATKTFYYNNVLSVGDTLDGDFCEWNDYYQVERVVSPYYQKIKYNQHVFQTTSENDTNSPGYYYAPHNPMTIRVFSDYIETGDAQIVDGIPSYSYYSKSDNQFRWRDLYTYGFIDNLGRGVDYPYLNGAQYPYKDVMFRLIPEGANYNEAILSINYTPKPVIDGCE